MERRFAGEIHINTRRRKQVRTVLPVIKHGPVHSTTRWLTVGVFVRQWARFLVTHNAAVRVEQTAPASTVPAIMPFTLAAYERLKVFFESKSGRQ